MSLDALIADLDAISAKMDSLFELTDTFLAEQARLLQEENGSPNIHQLQSDYAKISEESKAGHLLFSKFAKNFEKVRIYHLNPFNLYHHRRSNAIRSFKVNLAMVDCLEALAAEGNLLRP